ncbi:MAG: YitT family protein [Clostridia bacterium]|nr:YitT family protein [Clostridia bacterium]
MQLAKLKKKHMGLMQDAVSVAVGALLFAVSMNMFLLPAGIVLGGMTGVATVINLFWGLPIGLMILLLNVPLLIVNTKRYGMGFTVRTLIGLVSTSTAVDLLKIFPVTVTDPLLCAIFGGLTMGASVGTLVARGFTTGGTDLIASLLKAKWPKISTGSLVMMADLVIIVGAALLTGDYNGIFYSVICIFASGKLMDHFISGASRGGLALVVSSKPETVASAILRELNRGVTLLQGRGGWSGEEKQVVMCVVSRREVFFLKQTVIGCDPGAFIIIGDAAEVMGQGFARKNHLAG